MTTESTMASGQHAAPSNLPLFYRRPVPIQAGPHARYGLKREADFRFAANTTALPLNVGEFLPALRHYPIVFSSTETPTPLLVLGLKVGQNLFVNAAGEWRSRTYVPAYLRRYPFIIIETADRKTQVLAIDEASERISTGDGEESDRFFDDAGGPAPVAQSALTFCQAFHQEHLRTQEFVTALTEAKLLVSNRADIQFPDNGRYTLDGFLVIDETALHNLPSDRLAAWHQKGWLALAYLHLASQQNWALLLEANNQTGETR